MALYNSAYAVALPFIFLFTLPIALLASLTTFIAFSVLLVRVTFVYIELALAVIPYYLFGPPTKPPPPSAYEALRAAPSRRRRRRTSSSSNLSGTGGSITPVAGENNLWALSQSIGPTRDFEGVGGWRLDADLADDDGLWTNINTRLELPADHGRRHHHRSLTSGSVPADVRFKRSASPEPIITSNTSKVRTSPPSSVWVGGDAVPPAANTSKGLKRNNSGIAGMNANLPSSAGSKGSPGLHMKQR